MSTSILNNDEVEALLSAIEGGQVLVGQKVESKKIKRFNTMISDVPIGFLGNKNVAYKRLVKK